MELAKKPVLATRQQGSAGSAAPTRQQPVSAENRRGWQVDCNDAGNRHRTMTVLVDQDNVVLVGPPGEMAVLSAHQVGQLQAALREAADQAER